MAKSIFNEPDDQDAKVADRNAVASIKEKVASARRDDEGEPIEVDLDDANEDLEEREERAAAPPDKTRAEKRKERYRTIQEEREQARKERDEAKQELTQLRQMMEFARQQQPAAEPAKQEDPAATARQDLARAFEENDMLYRDFHARAAQMSDAEKAEFYKKANDLRQRMVELGGEIAVLKHGLHKAPNAEQIKKQVAEERLMAEHGDVMGDPQKRLYCQGIWHTLRARGKPDDWATIAEAAERTRKEFGIPTKTRQPAPSESYKRKLSGMPRGGGSVGDDAPRVVTMTKMHQQLANAAYKHIKDPAERMKRWAAGPGAKMLDKQKAG